MGSSDQMEVSLLLILVPWQPFSPGEGQTAAPALEHHCGHQLGLQRDNTGRARRAAPPESGSAWLGAAVVLSTAAHCPGVGRPQDKRWAQPACCESPVHS